MTQISTTPDTITIIEWDEPQPTVDERSTNPDSGLRKTAGLMGQLLQVPKEEAEQVHRSHSNQA